MGVELVEARVGLSEGCGDRGHALRGRSASTVGKGKRTDSSHPRPKKNWVRESHDQARPLELQELLYLLAVCHPNPTRMGTPRRPGFGFLFHSPLCP